MDDHKASNPSETEQQKLILLVEDDATMARLITDLISEEIPSRIVWGRNIMEAWQLTEGGRPDLLLLDYMLPGVHGLTVSDLLRTIPGWENIPTLVLSAGPYRDAVENRDLPFLAKPFEADDLLEQIQRLMNQQQQ